jgi:hypothetical protein
LESIFQGNASGNVMQALALHGGIFLCVRQVGQVGDDLGSWIFPPIARPDFKIAR